MAMRDAVAVATRCVCFEVLLERLTLEEDESTPIEQREAARLAWVARASELGIERALMADERAMLECSVGGLTHADCDAIEVGTIKGLALLWALGRIPTLPDAAMLAQATTLVAHRGILGDGAIPAVHAAVARAELRSRGELNGALLTAVKAVGEHFLGGPEHMVASLVVEALSLLDVAA